MARINNLSNFLTDVATAIKAKIGDNTPIPASEFDTAIMSITTGGNYQQKSITIEQNGTFNLLPDTGYDAMDSVTMTVDVSGEPMDPTTATADDVINPKTFYSNGQKLTGGIMPEYLQSSLIFDTTISNNSGYSVFDIDYNHKLALVGSVNGSNIIICTVNSNNIINTRLNIARSSISSAYNYLIRDMKFSTDYTDENICKFFVLMEVYSSGSRFNNTQPCQRLLTTITYNILENAYSFVNRDISQTFYSNAYGCDQGAYARLYIYEDKVNVIAVRPFCGTNSNGSVRNGTPMTNYCYSFNNNTLTQLFTWSRSFTLDTPPFNQAEKTAQATNDLIVEYDASTYIIYAINNNSVSRISYGTDHTSGRVIIVDGIYYLKGTSLYNKNGVLVKTYTGSILPGTYKNYCNGYLYEFNTNTKNVSIYAFNNETLSLTLVKTYTNTITTHGISTPIITEKPYSNNICINFQGIHCDYSGIGNHIKSLTIGNSIYANTDDATATVNDVIQGKIFYTYDGKHTGTIPNNGSIIYTPSTSSQSIANGYHSGSYIRPVTSDIDINIVPQNIKNGVTILGVLGTFEGSQGGDATSDANLQAKYLLEGYSMVADGQLIAGTMHDYGNYIITATSNDITIPEGHYASLSIPVINASNCDDYTECNQAILSI